MSLAYHGNKKMDGSGYWEHTQGRWWAVYRRTTTNHLVGVYPTEEEAKEAYEKAQKEYDDEREEQRKFYENKRNNRPATTSKG